MIHLTSEVLSKSIFQCHYLVLQPTILSEKYISGMENFGNKDFSHSVKGTMWSATSDQFFL